MDQVRRAHRSTFDHRGVAVRAVLLAMVLVVPRLAGLGVEGASAVGGRVTICHRTHATGNPYRRITVSVSAVNGSSNNDHTHHAGAPFDANITYPSNAKIWGDVIPNNASGGAGAGLNWDGQGQAIYNGTQYGVANYSGTCGAMSAQQFLDTELAAEVPLAEILADLDDQQADEDAAILADIGSFSSPSGSSGAFTPPSTTSTTTSTTEPPTTTSTTEPPTTTTTEPTTTTSEPPTTTTTTTEPPTTTTTEPTTTTSSTEPPTTTTSGPLGRVVGIVWIDSDKDGIQDQGEAVLPGVPVDLVPAVQPVKLRRGSAPLQLAAASSSPRQLLTGPDGRYDFESVVPGDYNVVAHLSAAGIVPWWDSDGSSDWSVGLVVPIGTARADLAAVGSSNLAGQVYFNSTGNGVSQAPVRCSWSGLDGVLGTADDSVFTVAANADGTFSVANAPFGVYVCAGTDPATGQPSAAATAVLDSVTTAEVRLPVQFVAPVTVPTALPRTGASSQRVFLYASTLAALGLALQLLARRVRLQPAPLRRQDR